ncbi:MAG: dihydropteroate synthase [Cellvibrionaceae bacterium]|nr:dihydropteroate synthase [Cellvibrionaceae bacterium]
MAIMNATPDSFSDGGLLYQRQRLSLAKVSCRLELLVSQGADIIDIGGESTRPGAAAVSVNEELDRVMPIVEAATQYPEVAISVDTSTAEVITEAAARGAHLINDVRALRREGALAAAVASQLSVCLMHMQGAPTTMQLRPHYTDVVAEVCAFLQQRVAACLQAGMDPGLLMLDPGFGFGKTLEHNLQLLRELPKLSQLRFPVLVGLSRKSMIGHLLQRELNDRLPASLALAVMALERGANVLRVHDVSETRDAIDTFIAVSH